jgi:translation initiation factor IF-1
MKQDKNIKKTGIVLEALPSTHFKVRLDEGREVLAHLAGKLRMFHIKILPGDRVTVEMTPYDETKGRIVYRGK